MSTIVEAIRTVLASAPQPKTAVEIYQRIVEANLYDFKARDPIGVVTAQLRRHCVNYEFASSRAWKYFEVVNGGKYSCLDSPVHLPGTSGNRPQLDRI